MKKRIVCFIVLLALFARCEEVPDFGAAFGAIWALDDVELKVAVLVKAEPDFDRGDMSSINQQVRMMTMMGRQNIWPRLPESRSQPEATHWLISSNSAGRVTLLGPYGQVTKGFDLGAGKPKKGETVVPYKIRHCNLSSDLKLIEGCLDKLLKKKEEAAKAGDKNFRYSIMSFEQSQMLYALAALYKAGHKDDANRLAQKLLKTSEDPEKVITGVIASMGTHQYKEIIKKLSDAKVSLSDVVKEIDKLLERFGEDWRGYSAAKSIRNDIEKHIALKSVPAIEGLNAEQQKIAKALVRGIAYTNKLEKSIYSLATSGSYNWLYDFEVAGKAKQKSVMLSIISEGMESIPLLAAMCGDHTLTGLIRDDSGAFGIQRTVYHSFSNGREKSMKRSDLPGPVTRSEFAVSMLNAVLPREDGRRSFSLSNEPDSLAIKENALTFYNENKGKSMVKMAFKQLESSENLDRSVFPFVANACKGDADLSAKVEKLLLEMIDKEEGSSLSYSLFPQLQVYCSAKGSDAAGFVKKVGVKLGFEESGTTAKKEEPKDKDAKDADDMYASKSNSGDSRANKYLEQMYKQMKKQVETGPKSTEKKDFKTLIAEWKKLDPQSGDFMAMSEMATGIATLLSEGESMNSMHEKVLDAALGAKDADECVKVLQFVTVLALSEQLKDVPAGLSGLMGMNQPTSQLKTLLDSYKEDVVSTGEENKKSTAKYNPAEHADKWRKLVADTRKISDESSSMGGLTCEDVSEIALIMICSLSYEREFYKVFAMGYERAEKSIRAAVDHVLSGKPKEDFEWPGTEELSNKEVEKLAARIKAMSPAQVKKFMEEDASNSEYMAVGRVLEVDKTLAPSFADFAAEIKEVTCPTNLTKTVSSIVKDLKGKSFSEGVLKDLHKKIVADKSGYEKSKGHSVMFMRSQGIGGWNIMASSESGESSMFSLNQMWEDSVDRKDFRSRQSLVLTLFGSGGQSKVYEWLKGGTSKRLINEDNEEYAEIKGEKKEDPFSFIKNNLSGKVSDEDAEPYEQLIIQVYVP